MMLATLSGVSIQLEPLTNQHREGMRVAANNDDIWTYMPQKAMGDSFNPWFDGCLDKLLHKTQITYAVRCKVDNLILGATAYYDIQLENKRLTLGYSWYTPTVWRSHVNPEVKLLMLTQAFEDWDMNRIEIGTDSRNIHSWQAIKKLGATQEGILRQHMILQDNMVTDTVVFSILAAEWSEIKMRLIERISVPNQLSPTLLI
jgi:RimJ/RimL family protein N-acetyltransferase